MATTCVDHAFVQWAGAGEVDEGEVAGMEPGLAAVLVDDDLASGDDVHLAEVGVHQLDVTAPSVGPARPGRRQLTDPDDAQVGGVHLVGRLVPVTGSHVERPEGAAHDLVDVLPASGGGNIVRPQYDGHGHILSSSSIVAARCRSGIDTSTRERAESGRPVPRDVY
jgi:hypothetical protein